MVLLTEHLVGRADELGSIERVLSELNEGRPLALELVGEPGIGKTRLLSELATRAEARGHLVLSGSASELERDLPYWVFVDALDDYLRSLDRHRLDALDDDIGAELADVFPSLAPLAASHGAVPRHERYRSHRAVRELFERLTATKPLVLVLDDLHWADSASVDLIGALLRRPPDAGVLMALAMRSRQVPERLSAAVDRAQAVGLITRLDLGAFSSGEAREFLGDSIDAAVATALYEETGGNPFYLEQLARSLGWSFEGTAAVPGLTLADLDVPAAVAAALAEELTLLEDGTRLVLEGAAIAGDPFDTELAAAAAAIAEPSVLPSVDVLLSLDFVRQTDVPRRFRFRHPLVRRAVYESTPVAWRLGAHERCAEALATRGALAGERAHHVERFARDGDAAAVAVLREAGEEVVHRAPASAARWFACALRLLSVDAPAEERVQLLLAQARARTATGQFDESRSALIESLALVPDDSVALRVELTTACAGVEHLLGYHEQAHSRLESALGALDDLASPEAVSLMIELAVDGYYRLEHGPMREWAERAVMAARPLDDRVLTAAALAAAAHACALNGAMDEADQHRAEAATLIDALPDPELALRLDAPANLAAAELDLDRLAEAGAHAERAMAIGQATGQSEIVPIMIRCLAWVRRRRGELAESRELLEGAVEAGRLSGNVQSLAANLMTLSLSALAAGDLKVALTTAEESVELASQLDHGLVSAGAGHALASTLLEAGDARRAVDALLGSAGGDELPFVPNAWRAHWLELLTRCQLAVGRVEEAERSAALSEACAATFGARLASAIAHRAAAAVALESSDSSGAAERSLASAVAADEVGARIEAALSRTLAGRALAQSGQPERALSELQRAAEELHQCGAIRYRDAAEREMRKLGRPMYRRTSTGKADATGVDSLTGRELQVARLIVDRNTNPEIAARLFLSPKTVETHVRNIFRKLGVSSRVEVARAVERYAGANAASDAPSVHATGS
jgi:ATP/maltotriose-dependent transcriptional regulator MalT